jgi:hypothetical protein
MHSSSVLLGNGSPIGPEKRPCGSIYPWDRWPENCTTTFFVRLRQDERLLFISRKKTEVLAAWSSCRRSSKSMLRWFHNIIAGLFIGAALIGLALNQRFGGPIHMSQSTFYIVAVIIWAMPSIYRIARCVSRWNKEPNAG